MNYDGDDGNLEVVKVGAIFLYVHYSNRHVIDVDLSSFEHHYYLMCCLLHCHHYYYYPDPLHLYNHQGHNLNPVSLYEYSYYLIDILKSIRIEDLNYHPHSHSLYHHPPHNHHNQNRSSIDSSLCDMHRRQPRRLLQWWLEENDEMHLVPVYVDDGVVMDHIVG